MKMMYFVLLAVALARIVGAQDVTAFESIIAQSDAQCAKIAPANKQFASAQCPGTFTAVMDSVPGKNATVQKHLGRMQYLWQTFVLCYRRSNGGPTDWNVISRTADRTSGKNSDTWTKCSGQIDNEKVDCSTAQMILCQFKQGTSFACVNDAQTKRSCTTLEKGDECGTLSAYAEGRPTNSQDFNARIAETRAQCAKNPTDREQLRSRCPEQSVEKIENNLPAGVTMNAAYQDQPGLQATITMCQGRLDAGGFERIRQKTISGTVIHDPTLQKACTDQLVNETGDCIVAGHMVCAYSFGVSLSCAKQELAWRVKANPAPVDKCLPVVQYLKTDSLYNPTPSPVSAGGLLPNPFGAGLGGGGLGGGGLGGGGLGGGLGGASSGLNFNSLLGSLSGLFGGGSSGGAAASGGLGGLGGVDAGGGLGGLLGRR